MAEAEELRIGQGLALGVSIDGDGDVVLLVVIHETPESVPICAPLMPDVARHFARRLREMSRDADKLQDQLGDLSPEELHDRLNAIRNKSVAP